MKKNETAPPEGQQPKAEVRPLGPTPWDHGRDAGHIKAARALLDGTQDRDVRSWAFRAAEVLHGWATHQLHSPDPLILTRDDYDAAIAAAQSPDERGAYTPHAAALAPHLRKEGTK
jgi:hypothetical protein